MIRKVLKDEIRKAVIEIVGVAGKTVDFSVANNGRYGDYSSNVAMVLGFNNARESAEKIKEGLLKSETIKNYCPEIKIAGSGFLNFFISQAYLIKEVVSILKEQKNYGSLDIGRGQKIQIEFISANPTGPLTLGNGRGGIFGDVLGNVLKKTGAEVLKEYYINDAGRQVEILMENIKKGEGEYIESIKRLFSQDILENIKETVLKMGIVFDVWFSEKKELRDAGRVEEIIKWLKERELAYESEGALWFKAIQFGDEKDRVLIKSDGEPTYFGVDCAYHYNKFVERKFDKVINIWGADHHGDTARLKGFVEALGFKDRLEIILMQFVRLINEGVAMRMSKRKGIYVFVDDILKEVGRDAFRFFMLMYSTNTHMDFDLALAKERSQKNPVYYVQYAYARIHSIFAKFKIHDPKFKIRNSKLELLNHPAEIALIRQLVRLPEIIEDTAKDYQVQRLPQYALELVRAFHKFYEDCRIVDEAAPELTRARLALVEATRIVIKNTLDILGISALEKM